MNILFLSMSRIDGLNKRGIYHDLMRELNRRGHNIYSVTAVERRENTDTYLKEEGQNKFLVVKTFNIQKTNIIEKGIGTLLITSQFKNAIKKYFKGVKFDLIIYPTPPITLYGVVKYFKKKSNARTYLMLKDIFPQNALDIGLMRTTGLQGLIYKYFRKQEKNLYKISDKIGCMSKANVEYILKHNPEIKREDVEEFPNSIEVQDINLTAKDKEEIRNKYGLPLDKKIFVYGGNLGKPQDIPFIIECLKAEKDNDKVCFLIAGDGTEFKTLETYYNEAKQSNFYLFKRLPAAEFDTILAACDVGLIFLDKRFTIPNFPSRLLSYLQASVPVIACTDDATDIGEIIEKGGFGWWSKSDNVEGFVQNVNKYLASNNEEGKIGHQFIKDHYSVEKLNYKHLEGEQK